MTEPDSPQSDAEPATPPEAEATEPEGQPQGEPTPEPEPKDKALQGQLSRKFAQVAREKKAIAQERAQIEAERQKLAKWHEAYQAARKDPEAWLREAGLTYDDLVEYKRTGKPAEPKTQDEIAKLRAELAELKNGFTAKEAARAEREYIDNIRKVTESDPDRFELVRLHGAHDEVYRYMDGYYRQHGEVLDMAEAAEVIEDLLLEQEEARHKKALASKKLARRLNWEPQQQTTPAGKPPVSAAQKKPTINNALAPTTAAPPKYLTPQELEEEWEASKRRRRG